MLGWALCVFVCMCVCRQQHSPTHVWKMAGEEGMREAGRPGSCQRRRGPAAVLDERSAGTSGLAAGVKTHGCTSAARESGLLMRVNITGHREVIQ